MANAEQPLSQEEFESIYAKVPRLTVEVIVVNARRQIYLTKRAIEPCKDQWHLPGGTVRFGELIAEAVKRIAKRELDIEVENVKNVGYIEYPSHFEHGLDSPVGIVFEVESYLGIPNPNNESKERGWFTRMPKNMHADQDEFLLMHEYLSK